MNSLKVQAIITILNDTDFDEQSLLKIKDIAQKLADEKYASNLKNHYLEQLVNYAQDESERKIFSELISNAKFIKLDDHKISVHIHNYEYKIELNVTWRNSVRIFDRESGDYWDVLLNYINENGFNYNKNARIGPPSKENASFALFLLNVITDYKK